MWPVIVGGVLFSIVLLWDDATTVPAPPSEPATRQSVVEEDPAAPAAAVPTHESSPGDVSPLPTDRSPSHSDQTASAPKS